MKKLYVLLICACFNLTAFAQNVYEMFPIGNELSIYENNFTWGWEKGNGDTVGFNTGTPRFLSPDSQTLLTSQMAGQNQQPIGYWFGTNFDPSSGIAMDYWIQCWNNDAPAKIEGIIAWIGKKENNSNSQNSKLELSLYNMSANQVIIGGQQGNFSYGEGASGTPLASVSKSINDILFPEEMGFNYFPLSTAVNVNAKFAIVSNFASLRANNDVSCLFFDSPGNGLNMHYTHLCVNQLSSSTCFSVNYASGGQLDVNVGLFAVVGQGSANINSSDYFQGMQLSCYPNPAIDVITVDYTLLKSADTQLQIISIEGKVISQTNFGFQSNGSYSHQIDISAFSEGTYFISLNSSGSRLIKKIVK